MLMILMFFLSLLISILIILIPLIFYKKKKELFQIESGFQTISKTSLKSFSLNFFYILIIFIIFDLELIFIFSFLEKISLYFLFLIIFFIIFTLWVEWITNKIKWIN